MIAAGQMEILREAVRAQLAVLVAQRGHPERMGGGALSVTTWTLSVRELRRALLVAQSLVALTAFRAALRCRADSAIVGVLQADLVGPRVALVTAQRRSRTAKQGRGLHRVRCG